MVSGCLVKSAVLPGGWQLPCPATQHMPSILICRAKQQARHQPHPTQQPPHSRRCSQPAVSSRPTGASVGGAVSSRCFSSCSICLARSSNSSVGG